MNGGGGKMEIIYPLLHCHHRNDSCIEMGSGESHFSVSIIVRDKVTRQCPQTTTFEEKDEPKWNQAEAHLLTSLTPYRWVHDDDRFYIALFSALGQIRWAFAAYVILNLEVLLYVHRNHRLIRDGSPGRPPRLSHTSWALILNEWL